MTTQPKHIDFVIDHGQLYEVQDNNQLTMLQDDFKENNNMQKQMKETYVAMSQLLNEFPNSMFLRNMQYEPHAEKLILERCNIDEKCIKSIVCMLINFKDQIRILSLQNNKYFKDFCLKQFIEYLIDTTHLKCLSLEKVNVSDTALMKLFDVLPSLNFDILNLSSNPINYCGFDHLSKVISENGLNIKYLNLSNTKLTDRSGIDLFDVVVQHSQVEELDLSRNPGLGYKFAINAINTAKSVEDFTLFSIELSYCGVSLQNQKQLREILAPNVTKTFAYQQSTISNMNPINTDEFEGNHNKSLSDQIPSRLVAKSFDGQQFRNVHVKNKYSIDQEQQRSQAPVTINIQDLMNQDSSSRSRQEQNSKSGSKRFTNHKNLTPSNRESMITVQQQSSGQKKKKSKLRNNLQDYLQQSSGRSSNIKHYRNDSQKQINISSLDEQEQSEIQKYNHDITQDSTPHIYLTHDQRSFQRSVNDDRTSHYDSQSQFLRCEEQFKKRNKSKHTDTSKLLDNLKESVNKPIPKFQQPQGPYKLLQPTFTDTRYASQNLYKRVRQNSNRFIPYRQISPNKIPSYQQYYQQQKRKQAEVIQSKIKPDPPIPCFEKHLLQQASSELRLMNKSQLNPQILHKPSKEDLHSQSIKVIDMLKNKHQQQLEQLSTDRYSQRNAYKNYIQSRKIQSNQTTTRKTPERQRGQNTPKKFFSMVQNSKLGTPSASLTRVKSSQRKDLNDHTPQRRSDMKSYSTTKHSSSINTIRCKNPYSNEKPLRLDFQSKEFSEQQSHNQSVNEVSNLKSMIKNEIERLQYLYQTIDNVMVQHSTVDDASTINYSQVI